ncbi:STAS domain-containing protein [Streptomyces sp. NPDC005227]|uniref:STAS domain-containing protein n=1 Tax=unclassified Streptomyces TaxID=2593676 RepID=UPI0036A57FED
MTWSLHTVHQDTNEAATAHPYVVTEALTDPRIAASLLSDPGTGPSDDAALLALSVPPHTPTCPGEPVNDRTLTATCHHHASGATVLTVAGELDHHTAPDLARVVQETPFSPDVPLLMDVSELTYCDSTGLTVFVSAYDRALKAESRLLLVGMTSDMTHLFRIVGLDQLFTFQPTVEDAIDALLA